MKVNYSFMIHHRIVWQLRLHHRSTQGFIFRGCIATSQHSRLLCGQEWTARQWKRYFFGSLCQSLVVALVLLRLDYDNMTLAGLPAGLHNRLQSVLNAAAQSIASLCRSGHITDALASFHWLRAP